MAAALELASVMLPLRCATPLVGRNRRMTLCLWRKRYYELWIYAGLLCPERPIFHLTGAVELIFGAWPMGREGSVVYYLWMWQRFLLPPIRQGSLGCMRTSRDRGVAAVG